MQLDNQKPQIFWHLNHMQWFSFQKQLPISVMTLQLSDIISPPPHAGWGDTCHIITHYSTSHCGHNRRSLSHVHWLVARLCLCLCRTSLCAELYQSTQRTTSHDFSETDVGQLKKCVEPSDDNCALLYCRWFYLINRQ